MVKPFTFARIPKIIFRPGGLSDLPGIITKFGKNILLVTGRHSFLSSNKAAGLFETISAQNIVYEHIIIETEPTPQIIDQTVNLLKDKKIDLVVSIGGGSVIDAGKAVSAMMYKQESVFEFLEVVGGKEHPGTKIPFIAVPTTSGTGSEATKNAVISQIGENGFKRSLRHDNFISEIALVDPELTLNCPDDITASSGMDCFTQLTEAYLSDKSTEYTDALAIEGLKQIKASLVESYIHGEDLEARTGMSFSALTSGICLANAGLGVIHGFASSIGGMFNIPHGLICGRLMSSSNEVNIRVLRETGMNPEALKKYATLGKLFLGKSGKTDNYYIDYFVSYLHKLTYDFKLPGLSRFGVGEKDFNLICSKTDNKNNPVKLMSDDLREILTSVVF
jgi:alcohol dehydrogenase class IV